MKQCIKQLFSIDIRTLALYRIVLGISLILQMLTLYPLRWHLLDDSGITPHTFTYAQSSSWSLYFISGTGTFAGILLLLSAFIALLFTIGYRTRLMGFLLWVLICSLERRNYWTLNGGDWYSELLLMWTLFLPTSAIWSVDAMLSPGRESAPRKVFSIGTIGIIVQVSCMYLFGGLLKLEHVEWTSGNALYLVLNSHDVRTSAGALIAGNYELLRFMSFCVVYLELFAIAGLFFPWKNPVIRMLTLLLLATMHMGFIVLMDIGLLPYACLCGLMILIPSEAWDCKLTQKLQGQIMHRLAPLHTAFTSRAVSLFKNTEDKLGLLRGPAFRNPGKITTGLGAAIIAVTLYWNTSSIVDIPTPTWLGRVVAVTHLQQRMGFFSPPWQGTAQVMIEGERYDGSKVDLLFERSGAPKMTPAEHAGDLYPNNRLRSLFRGNVQEDERAIGRFYCRSFPVNVNPKLGHGLKSVLFTQYYLRTHLPDQPKAEPYLNHQFRFTCSDGKVERLSP